MTTSPSNIRFPTAYALGFTSHNKTTVRAAVEIQISHYLWRHVPPPTPSSILPTQHEGHSLTGRRINLGRAHDGRFLAQQFQYCSVKYHPTCPKRYHVISDPPPDFLRQHPHLQRLLDARREVAPTPRRRVASVSTTPSSATNHPTPSSGASNTTPNRRRTRFGPPVTPESPLARVRLAIPPTMVLPVLAMPSTTLDSLVPSETEHSAVTEGLHPPALHYDYSGQSTTPSVTSPLDDTPPIFARAGSTMTSSSSDTSTDSVRNLHAEPAFFARDGSIISISSGSSGDEMGGLLYPDVTSGASWLVWNDYRHALRNVGFESNEREIFLPQSRIWLYYPTGLPYPISQPNTILFIRPAGASTLTPDDVLDALF
ncbi:hypothetical protein C8R45DRAFT_927683 [Mycena sanguinolenta]|nr:hypothetical protein C8R45DRAFT_927683 [Mycena sanguinolenta]